MKKLYFKISFIVLSVLCLCGCSDDNDKNYVIDEYNGVHAKFVKQTLSVSQTAGKVIALLSWAGTEWEIETEATGGFITEISQKKGGGTNLSRNYEQVSFNYSTNTTDEFRSQDIYLVNKNTGERSKMTIEQRPQYLPVKMSLDPITKYQEVVGFGGMYNPKIWIEMITLDEMEKIFNPDQLGYTILRLMIYPNEDDWAADVEGARKAQLYGAKIFSSPWEAPAELNSKEGDKVFVPRENYQAYTDHILKYINYMKENGVYLDVVSIRNEPDIDGTYWAPEEMVYYLKNFGAQIRDTGVKLMAPEACGMSPEFTDPILNDPGSFANTDIVAGHLYQGFTDLSNGYVKARHDYICSLYDRLSPARKSWWMTEKYFNDEGDNIETVWNFQLNNFGKELHMCMESYCSGYVYWYLKRSNGQCGLIGTVGDKNNKVQVDANGVAKDGYLMAHYAKYASNMIRIKVENENEDILATAYINKENTEMTIVLLNLKDEEYKANITSPKGIHSVMSAVETTVNKSMENMTANVINEGGGISVALSANSIVSVAVKLQ